MESLNKLLPKLKEIFKTDPETASLLDQVVLDIAKIQHDLKSLEDRFSKSCNKLIATERYLAEVERAYQKSRTELAESKRIATQPASQES